MPEFISTWARKGSSLVQKSLVSSAEGQVGVQQVVFVTRLTNELVHLKGSLCNSSGAIPCEIPLAFAAVARRRAFFAQGDESWFILVETIHCSREGFLVEM